MKMDNGRDLVEMLCTSYESEACDDDPNEHYDFSASPSIVMTVVMGSVLCHKSNASNDH